MAPLTQRFSDNFSRGAQGLVGANSWKEFSENPVVRNFDPGGFLTYEYNPFVSNEEKFGKPPGSQDEYMRRYGGGGQGPGTWEQFAAARGGLNSSYINPHQMAQYEQDIRNLENAPVDMNSPMLQQLMQNAGLGAMQAAKQQGIRGPYSAGANEQARYQAGLGYAQQQQQQNQARAMQMRGMAQQYGQQGAALDLQRQQGLMGAYGDANKLAEMQRQYNTNYAQQRYQNDVNAYQQRRAQHMGPVGSILNMFAPGAGTSATGAYGGMTI